MRYPVRGNLVILTIPERFQPAAKRRLSSGPFNTDLQELFAALA